MKFKKNLNLNKNKEKMKKRNLKVFKENLMKKILEIQMMMQIKL